MKYLIWLLFLLFFCNCEPTGRNKFVVEVVSQSSQLDEAVYQLQSRYIFEFSIVDSIGKYNVGDTLILVKK